MTTSKELPKTYSPSEIEEKWYQIWSDKKLFSPVEKENSKGPYSIIMPPPNVTGKLHMGHALNQTCQDIIIRFKRMKGFETLWIPGYDHAGISTQAVVEKKVYEEEKKTKHDLGREEFVKRIWDWKEEYGKEIINQLKKLGVSCDWDYFSFTMDEVPNLAVRKVFTKLYNEGLIYQADYIVNWDPILQSAISDAEVDHKEVEGNFYYLKYFLPGTKDFLTVATTRPETLYGDTAIAVNPADNRFKNLIGKTAIIPLLKKEIPIIGDEYVDMELGTGCLKVTPGHDFNDFEIGKRHKLPIVNILNKDGTLNENAPLVNGLNAQKAREKTLELLKENDLLIKVESHKHQVGHGERSGEIIEPMVSKQWFLNIKEMAENALLAVEKEEMLFIPKGWENTYFSWLKEPRDWCLSRQLWWGHQIPVFTCHDCEKQWASEKDSPQCPECSSEQVVQDPDVLDTWFSSGLWPLSTLGWPDEKAMKEKGFHKFYPTSTLMTGFDIIFFWVARMMMMGIRETEKSPFKNVYIHAIVRDKLGRKMSKSLGNGIDPLEVIQKHGADALRFALSSGAGHGRSLNLDPDQIENQRNFINKIWNAFRFIYPFLENAQDELPKKEALSHHDRWILGELNRVAEQMNKYLEEFRFDEASSRIYSFIYDKFCSWYIEVSKVPLYKDNEEDKNRVASVLKYSFKKVLALIHPFIPHFTEEIWGYLKNENEPYLIRGDYPEPLDELDFSHDGFYMNRFIETITQIRNLRASVNINPKEEISVYFFTDDPKWGSYLHSSQDFLYFLAKVKEGVILDKTEKRPEKAIMGASSFHEVFIPLEGVVDIKEQSQRIIKQLEKLEREEKKVLNKLNNPKFMNNAPENVVEEVREKARKFQDKRESLEKSLRLFSES